VLETEDSFVKLVSKHRFPKLKNFALKMYSTLGSTYTFFQRLNHFVGSGPKVATFS